jgi:hypothetical protein
MHHDDGEEPGIVQEIVGKRLVIVQKIWYYTRRRHR